MIAGLSLLVYLRDVWREVLIVVPWMPGWAFIRLPAVVRTARFLRAFRRAAAAANAYTEAMHEARLAAIRFNATLDTLGK